MENDDQQTTKPTWKPIPRIHRRVLGVLVEKAKTTPNGYPLSLNGVITGSNQKSNRSPKMELTLDDAEDALEELRTWGAVGEVHGDGRVVKYRHYMKDWLGVDGTELAVMAELMLRGAQTVGELRSRSARMAGSSLPDVSALRPVLNSLIEKKLVASLSPPGRGQVVTHTLFLESEMDKVKSTHADAGGEATMPSAPVARPAEAPTPHAATAAASSTSVSANASSDSDSGLRVEVEALRQEVARLKKEVEDIWENLSS